MSFNIKTYGDDSFRTNEKFLLELFFNNPIPDDEKLKNLGLFLNPGTLGRILYMYDLYRQIVGIQGCIAEFGCRFGQNLVLFNCLRGILEPYNRLRKIIGFDTFEGFVNVSSQDGEKNNDGDYNCVENYEQYINRLMEVVEQFSPLNHLKKYEIIKGDASETVIKYISANQHVLFSLCYFDMDIYKPTRDVLSAILPRMGKGSILAFDELNDEDMPGETIAVLELLKINNFKIRRSNLSTRTSYVVL